MSEAAWRCPNCGEHLVRKKAGGWLLVRTLNVFTNDDQQTTVLRCPNRKCKRNLELKRGRLLLFNRPIPAAT